MAGEVDFAALRLIVVDDTFSSRRVTAKLCGKLGFSDIAQAESGAQAVTALTADTVFDLVFTDLNLGDMTALELMQQVRAAKPELKTKFVIMTSDVEADMLARLNAAGMSGYLLKPLELGALEDKFREVLGA